MTRMFRDTVSADSTQVKTKKCGISDPDITSESSGPAGQMPRPLTYLAGADDTMDIGMKPEYMGAAMTSEEYRCLDALRRHTVQQGFATFTRSDFE